MKLKKIADKVYVSLLGEIRAQDTFITLCEQAARRKGITEKLSTEYSRQGERHRLLKEEAQGKLTRMDTPLGRVFVVLTFLVTKR